MTRPSAGEGDGEPENLQHHDTEANGFRLHYVVAGHGPPVVLLHGDGASAVDWRWVLPGLARAVRVHALDFPGHGDSAKPSTAYSPELLTDTLIAFLDAVGIDRAVLVGHSLGGLVAIRTALRIGERVSALCLVDSGGLGRYVHPAIAADTLPGLGEASAAFGRTLPGSFLRAGVRATLLFARPWEAPAAWLDEQRRLITLPGFAQANLRTRRSAIDMWGQREFVLPELHNLGMPTLVMWGAADMVVPVSHALAATAVLPAAQLEVFPYCGHMPHVEAAGGFVKALTNFLRHHGLLPGV